VVTLVTKVVMSHVAVPKSSLKSPVTFAWRTKIGTHWQTAVPVRPQYQFPRKCVLWERNCSVRTGCTRTVGVREWFTEVPANRLQAWAKCRNKVGGKEAFKVATCNTGEGKYTKVENVQANWGQLRVPTRVGTLKVATIYLQLIQNRYMFRSFTVLQCSHQHCV